MTEREDRIRATAYLLWLGEGCPSGEAERHWLAAEAIIDSAPVELNGAADGADGGLADPHLSPAPARHGDEGRADLAELPRSIHAAPKRAGRGHKPSPAK